MCVAILAQLKDVINCFCCIQERNEFRDDAY